VDRENLLNPESKQKKSFVEQSLEKQQGPVIAATDYMKVYADQIRNWVPGCYKVLGTDGFGRSDSREKLRDFFEVDRHYITIAALMALAEQDEVKRKTVADALKKYDIDVNKPNPLTA